MAQRPLSALILLSLNAASDCGTRELHPTTYQTIARNTGLDAGTVRRELDWMKRKGWITWTPQWSPESVTAQQVENRRAAAEGREPKNKLAYAANCYDPLILKRSWAANTEASVSHTPQTDPPSRPPHAHILLKGMVLTGDSGTTLADPPSRPPKHVIQTSSGTDFKNNNRSGSPEQIVVVESEAEKGANTEPEVQPHSQETEPAVRKPASKTGTTEGQAPDPRSEDPRADLAAIAESVNVLLKNGATGLTANLLTASSSNLTSAVLKPAKAHGWKGDTEAMLEFWYDHRESKAHKVGLLHTIIKEHGRAFFAAYYSQAQQRPRPVGPGAIAATSSTPTTQPIPANAPEPAERLSAFGRWLVDNDVEIADLSKADVMRYQIEYERAAA